MSLSEVLQRADVEDLDVLTDYITDRGEGRLALDGDVCKRLVRCKQAGRYSESDRDLIGQEIRAFGGNTMINLFRREGIKYEELVVDVASHLKANFPKSADAADIEYAILQKIFTDSIAKMSDDDRRQVLQELNVGELTGLGPAQLAAVLATARLAGFGTYKMALVVANGISRSLLERGLTPAINAGLSRTLSLAIGPIGLSSHCAVRHPSGLHAAERAISGTNNLLSQLSRAQREEGKILYQLRCLYAIRSSAVFRTLSSCPIREREPKWKA
jgi:uncharacterized protein YaaW (UPF0174 family)